MRRGGLIMLGGIVALSLASCASRTAGTQVIEGRLMEPEPSMLVGARQTSGKHILVEVRRSGSFSNELTLTLDPQVQVFAGKKEIHLEQVQPGSAIKLWRDTATHRVKRIEMTGSLPDEDQPKTVDPKSK